MGAIIMEIERRRFLSLCKKGTAMLALCGLEGILNSCINTLCIVNRNDLIKNNLPTPTDSKWFNSSIVSHLPRIYFKASENMFPISWRKPPINAKTLNLPKNKIEKTREIIINELNKYPEHVLKNIQEVYVLNHLSFYEVSYGGTNSRYQIFLTNGNSRGHTNEYLKHALHHEFSSILLRNFPQYFDEENWRKNNPAGFKYFGYGIDAMKKGKASLAKNKGILTGGFLNRASIDRDEKFLKEGFLNQYAQSDLENDFNEFAGYMFCNDGTFWKDVERIDRLKEKYEIMLKFYQSLDKSLNSDYFKKISRL